MSITYKDSGVDVERGYEAVKLMKKHVAATFNDSVITDLGSFGGMYELGDGKVLVAGTDGVGTKLKAAFALNINNTVGIDCVAMCANDVVCHGAKPLFFLDYIAIGELKPETAEEIVEGIAEGCIQAGCALIGGETAEMPGFYSKDEYDLAGFCVGIVDKDKIINGSKIKPGNIIIGMASTGIHSNGFSLIRKLYNMDESLNSVTVNGITLGELLLKPTKIYVKPVLNLINKVDVLGLAHITGGGFIENIPRVLPEGLQAEIGLNSWHIPIIIEKAVSDAELSKKEAYNTFNMGIGMIAVVNEKDAREALNILKESDQEAYIIGKIEAGDAGVVLCE